MLVPTLLPRGVVAVSAPTNEALSIAGALLAGGIPVTALSADIPDDMHAWVKKTLDKHGHAVLVTTELTQGALAALKHSRTLGQAATIITTETVDAPTFVDRVITDPDGRDFIPVTGRSPDLTRYTGDFAVIGDTHGAHHTTLDLVDELTRDLGHQPLLVSLGDVHDKGARSVDALRWWTAQIRAGKAIMVDSNHAAALRQALGTGRVPRRGDVADTLAEIDQAPDAQQLRTDILAAFNALPTHWVLPGVVAVHAALTEHRKLRTDYQTRRFAIHTRMALTPWTWTGTETLVHGHDTVRTPTVRRAPASALRPGHYPGPVFNVDTGAHAGGGLTAYRSWSGTTMTVATRAEEAVADLESELSPQTVTDHVHA